jgi:murein DD-endopeptidase MepM/ murein hydrolase activator NlpD
LAGQLPNLVSPPLPDLSPGDLLPNDPRLPDLLAGYNFQMPLREALLPHRSAIYPGSRRADRYGVHQGLDLYGEDIGIDMVIGTPVYAASNGTIIKADNAYQEMSLAEVNSLLAEANALHITPPETLTKLNGREVWIDHGGGVATRYSHLSAIADGLVEGKPVTAGQLIGYVGLSGTLEGISGNTEFPHLHFEIRLGPTHQYYLGQWLTIEETRHAFENIFKIPVRPASLEFREQPVTVEPTDLPSDTCQEPGQDYSQVTVNGETINRRTELMLETAIALYGGSGDLKRIAQGSYTDALAASFGTHAGGGVVDISIRNPANPAERLFGEVEAMVSALRLAGFAAWYRQADLLYPDMAPHIHAVAIGDQELSSAAEEQLTGPHGYFRGYDGLPGDEPGPDLHGGPIICDWMLAAGYEDLRQE